MSFLGSIFGGGGGSNSSSNSNSTTNTTYSPQYTSLENQVLGQIGSLANAPFQPYDISKMFAGFNPTQQQAFDQVQGNQNSYKPYTGAAGTALDNAGQYNAWNAGSPFLNAAGSGPNAFQAGAGDVAMSGMGWNAPGVAQSYTNPFINNSVNAANGLATQNFLQNQLPGINSQFIGSGGGANGNNNAYGRSFGNAQTNFNTSLNNADQTALANNYWQGANQFNTDQSRLQSAGLGLGNLANTTQGTYGSLANTAGNLANTALTGGINLGNAYSNLGTNVSNLGLTNANALLQTGNQQQQQAQLPLTAAYNQFEQGIQWPYQTTQWASQAASPWKIPTTVTNNSSSNSTSGTNSSPSPFGSILSGITGVGSLFGSSAPGSSIFDGLGSIFGGGSSSGSSSINGLNQQAINNVASASPNGGVLPGQTPYEHGGAVRAKRGGHFNRIVERAPVKTHFADGGPLRDILGTIGSIGGGILGSIYGGPIGGMAGSHAGHGLGNGLGDLFGGDSGQIMPDLMSSMKPSMGDGMSMMSMFKEGGPTLRGRARRKGTLNKRTAFAAGGYAPVVRGYRPEVEKVVAAAAKKERKSPVAMKRGGYFAEGGPNDYVPDRMTPTPEERRLFRERTAAANERRASAMRRQADDSPGEYWGDFARQLPIGVAHGATGMAGFPGDVYDALRGTEEPSMLSSDRLTRGVDRLMGYPNGAPEPEYGGGQAGRRLGELAPLMFPPADATTASASFLKRMMDRAGHAAQGASLVSMPMTKGLQYRRGGHFNRMSHV